jgi:hypothetical protein
VLLLLLRAGVEARHLDTHRYTTSSTTDPSDPTYFRSVALLGNEITSTGSAFYHAAVM